MTALSERHAAITRVVSVLARVIRPLVAGPSKPPLADRSATVRKSRGPTGRLRPGATFSMDMRGQIPDRITNTVVAFDEAVHRLAARLWPLAAPAARGLRGPHDKGHRDLPLVGPAPSLTDRQARPPGPEPDRDAGEVRTPRDNYCGYNYWTLGFEPLEVARWK